MDEPPSKLQKAISTNNTNYHGEIDAILLALKHIFSTKSKVNANTIHIFSDSIETINAIAYLSPQEIHHDKTEEIIWSNLLKHFPFSITCSPAHCSITQNEEANRLAKLGVQAALKMIKGEEISIIAIAKDKNKTLIN